MSDVVTQLISVGGSVLTTLVAAWAKNFFERRKAAATANAEQKTATD